MAREVIAVVELLVAVGRLNPRDWSETLGAELDKRSHNGEPDDKSTYYETFLTALCSPPDNGFVQFAVVGALPACPNGSVASIRRTLSRSAMRAFSAMIADISDQQLRDQ